MTYKIGDEYKGVDDGWVQIFAEKILYQLRIKDGKIARITPIVAR